MDRELMINNIKQLCKNNSITLTRLEEILGFSQGLIGRWKDKNPTLDRVVDIADYFQTSLDEIVGRSKNFDDDFLQTIYDITDKGILKWHPANTASPVIRVPHEIYNEDKYDKLTYYTEFNSGYFIIDCIFEQIVNPTTLNFCIKPTNDSDIVFQNYTSEQLKPLWIAIINNLPITETPDELKAESLKQRFIETTKNLKNSSSRTKIYSNDIEMLKQELFSADSAYNLSSKLSQNEKELLNKLNSSDEHRNLLEAELEFQNFNNNFGGANK